MTQHTTPQQPIPASSQAPVQPPDPRPEVSLLTTRSALIFLLATLVAAVCGTLTYLARHSLPEACIAAGAAWGTSVGVFNKMISS